MTDLELSRSEADYLKAIYHLMRKEGGERVGTVVLAKWLGISAASVTSMVQKLADLGYVNYVKYRGLVLTDKGREVADRIQRRHGTLTRFFSLLGLDEETQQRDIEGIEHHLSAETVDCLASLAEFFEQNPDVLKKFFARHNDAKKRSSRESRA